MACNLCGEEDSTKFGTANGRPKTTCKSCLAKRERDRRILPAGRAAYRKSCQEYYARNTEFFAERRKKFHKDNPDWARNYAKKAAHRAKATRDVGHALVSGKLVRPDQCSNCGKQCKPEGHHDDYSKTLNVRWLCKSCHNEHHKSERLKNVD